jgi:hypothetical protein
MPRNCVKVKAQTAEKDWEVVARLRSVEGPDAVLFESRGTVAC